MFNIGFTELIFLMILALIVIGPKQLPEVARTLGRFINDLKRSTEDFTNDIKNHTTLDLKNGPHRTLDSNNQKNHPLDDKKNEVSSSAEASLASKENSTETTSTTQNTGETIEEQVKKS